MIAAALIALFAHVGAGACDTLLVERAVTTGAWQPALVWASAGVPYVAPGTIAADTVLTIYVAQSTAPNTCATYRARCRKSSGESGPWSPVCGVVTAPSATTDFALMGGAGSLVPDSWKLAGSPDVAAAWRADSTLRCVPGDSVQVRWRKEICGVYGYYVHGGKRDTLGCAN